MKIVKKTGVCLTLVLSFCLCFTLLAGCKLLPQPQPKSNKPDPIESLPSETTVPASYDEIFNVIDALSQKQQQTQKSFSGDNGSGPITEDATASEASPLADSLPAGTTSSNYSETNVQVEGVDEGDILKTDGENIYMVSGSEVVILRANGADTTEVGRINLDGKTVQKTLGDYPVYPQELYISGDTLAVLYQYTPNGQNGEASDSSNDDSASANTKLAYPIRNNVTELALFNMHNAANPQYLNSFGQDGYYSSSRLQDGILYLISNHSIYDFDSVEEDDPLTYVPAIYTGNQSTLLEPKDICILPLQGSVNYVVINSIDLTTGQRIDQQSILGTSSTTYMSPTNLYLAEQSYEDTVLDSYQDGSFTVTEYQNITSTRIAKLSLDQGSIEFLTDTKVEGGLLNQFSMDEYDGNLRLVTTVDSYRYRQVEDARGVIEDYQSYDSEPSTNALYVLDKQLRKVGTLDGLAEDERVYSVRFDGATGYFVTFKQVDPLFAVDLSDPADPTIKSTLKIPGFSTYMHPYAEGLLLGLGMAADEDGRTQGLKLSMFDITDPYSISEKQVLNLGKDSSAALYDHKAILIDQRQNIIGFQTDRGYVVYGYSEEEGFYLRKRFDNGTDTNSDYGYYTFNDRGLYIGSYFYLCGMNNIGVYALDSLEEITQVPLEVEDAFYGGVEPLAIEPSVEPGGVILD